MYEEDTETFAAQGERIEQLQERVGMLEEERVSAREAVEGAEAKAAALAELKDKLGASLKAKTRRYRRRSPTASLRACVSFLK